jgi:hypothetical protein
MQKTPNHLGTITEIVVWTMVSGALLIAASRLTSGIAQSAFGLFLVFPQVVLLVLLLILGGPAAVLIVGIRKRRLAMIAGPLLLIPIIAAYSIISSWFEMHRLSKDVAALDMRDFKTPSQYHDLIVLEYSRSTDCDELCKQILVRSDFSVGVPGYTFEPIVYRKITEVECKATWYSARNIRFAGICVTLDKVKSVDDALLIVTPMTFISGGGMWDLFPKLPSVEFKGNAFALVERTSGSADRVLGRWVAGEVTVWPFRSGQIGIRFDRKEFYAAALGLSLD